MMVSHLIFLTLGFVVLAGGADLLVRGAVHFATQRNISHWVVGLTIVAFGGSLPELFVNLVAVSNQNPGLAISNIQGSVVANILLVLGVAAVICALPIRKNVLKVDMLIGIGAILFVAVLAQFSTSSIKQLTRVDGFILLTCFVLFMVYALRHPNSEDGRDGSVNTKEWSLGKIGGMIAIGFVGLFLGARWIVNSATGIASILGMSESFVGFTIVAIGTSLPELAASAAASWRRHADIAVANVIGSNIFNVFFIIGISSTICPLPINAQVVRDWKMTLLASLLLPVLILIGRKSVLKRRHGLILLLVYFVYLGYLVSQQF